MELLERTIFKKKNEEIRLLQRRLDVKTKEMDELNQMAKESLEKALINNLELENKLEQTEKLRRKYAGAIGGCKAKINRLNDKNGKLAYELSELKKEFDEFKKGKFIIREMKPQKVPKSTQRMGIKSGAVTSRIITKVKESEIGESND